MRALLCLVLLASPAWSDSLVATRTIRAQTVLTEQDFTLVAAEIPGAVTDPALAIGLEARITLYAGRPIAASDIGPPALVDRNQTVSLIFRSGGLSILTEGRALERGAAGEVIRVMNLTSRATVSGTITPDGSVIVVAPQEG